jgi:hypothetical protein
MEWNFLNIFRPTHIVAQSYDWWKIKKMLIANPNFYQKFYLLVLSREWMGMGVAGILIDSYYR